MDPVTVGTLGSAAVGAATSIFGGGNSAKANRKLQEDAQKWQRSMRATQYQATVADMRKAGLNPMMLAHGSGLSQGMSSPLAQGGQLGEGIQKAGNKGMEAMMNLAQIKQMHSAADLNTEMKNKAIQDAALVHTQIGTEGAKAWSAQLANEVERIRLQHVVDNLAKQGQMTDAQVAQIYADMGLNDARENAMNASSAASQAAAALDRAGLPGARYKNSAVGIFMDEANRTANTMQGFLPWKKGGAADREKKMFTRSGARIYENP